VIFQLNRNRIHLFREYLLKSFPFTIENADKIISDTLLVLPNRISDDPYISLSGIHNNASFYHEVYYRQIVKHSITEEWTQLLERDLFKVLEANRPVVILTREMKNIKYTDIMDWLISVCN
jgi:hypothetical protein